ncbi:hypothetical protein STN76_10455 [Streptococcus agalactiae]
MGPGDLRAALGGYLFLLGLAFAIPWADAAPDWKHINTAEKSHTVIFGGTIILFTTAYLTGYFEKLFALDGPDKPHDNDNTVALYIKHALQAPSLKNPMKTHESIFDTASRLSKTATSWLTTSTVTRDDAEKFIVALSHSMMITQELRDNLREAVEKCEQQEAQIKEFMDTGALTPIGRPNNDWENMIQEVFPGIDDLTPINIKWRIENLKAKADYQPIFTLFGETTARERTAILNSQDLVQFIQNKLHATLKPLYDTIPEDFKTPGEDLLSGFQAAILQLRNMTTRLTNRLSKIPMEIETSPAIDTTLSDVVSAIPPEYQPAQLNKESIIASLWNWRGTQPQVAYKTPTTENLGCRHPRELRTELGEEESTTWERCLQIVADLIRRPQAQETQLYAVEPTRCFRSSDVPTFDDPDNYWTWRATFKRFALAEQVSDNAQNTAIARVLGRFTGKAAEIARPWQIQDIVLNNWHQTLNRFLSYADMRLLDVEFFDNQIKKWRGMRPRPGQSGLEFLRDFESQYLTINEVAQTLDRPLLEQGEMIRQAIAVLPAGVRNLLRLQQQNPDLMTPKQFFDSTIIAWNFVQNEERRSGKTHHTPARELRPSPARATGSPFSLPCNKPCFDSSPALPHHLRGKIRNQNGQVIEHYKNLCFRCRRDESEHGGVRTGCEKFGTHEYHTTTPGRHIAPPPGGDPGTQ